MTVGAAFDSALARGSTLVFIPKVREAVERSLTSATGCSGMYLARAARGCTDVEGESD